MKKPKKAQSEEYEYEEYEDEEEGENDAYDGMSAIGVQSLYISSGLVVTHRVPKPATCTTWNGNKVKTFDGLIYNHNLFCSHTLLQDRIDGSFSVVVRACSSSYKEPCSHAIDIMISNVKYKLENISKLHVSFISVEFRIFTANFFLKQMVRYRYSKTTNPWPFRCK